MDNAENTFAGIDDPFAATRFYTVNEICRAQQVGRNSIYKDINNGNLVPTYFGRAVRFSGPDYKRYLQSRRNSHGPRKGAVR